VLLAQIEAFVETARRGSVSRAADALFVTQPALTARLKTLERELGTPLFVRTSRSVTLTPAGAELAGALPPVLRRLDQALAAARDGRTSGWEH
jgi:DNA-binding transcriptional LysR family regulator